MKIYEVFTEVLYGPSHVVVANNESEAIEMTINYLNQSPTHPVYKPSDFYAGVIDVDKLSEPTLLYQFNKRRMESFIYDMGSLFML